MFEMRLASGLLLSLVALASTAAIGQDAPAGSVAESVVGKAGQRQAPKQVAVGIEPMARIDNRIRNRVQSRIRNRIDRNYDPQANAASPFEVASDRARTAGKPQ